jgi:hypothetical protein
MGRHIFNNVLIHKIYYFQFLTIARIFVPNYFDTNYYLMFQKLRSDCLYVKVRFDISTFDLKKVMMWKFNNSIRFNSQSRFVDWKT